MVPEPPRKIQETGEAARQAAQPRGAALQRYDARGLPQHGHACATHLRARLPHLRLPRQLHAGALPADASPRLLQHAPVRPDARTGAHGSCPVALHAHPSLGADAVSVHESGEFWARTRTRQGGNVAFKMRISQRYRIYKLQIPT